MVPTSNEPLPPESWPGAGGRRSVAPAVPRWPGRPVAGSCEPGASWPGAVSAAAGEGGSTVGWPGAIADADADPDADAGAGVGAGAGAAGAAPRSPLPPRLPEDVDAELREPANRVSPKAKPMWMMVAAFTEFFPLAAVVAWLVFDRDHRSFQWAVLAVLVIGAVLHIGVSPFWRYRVHRWEVTDAAVYTQSGWFSQERRIAPISRIQTVDAQFGPIERLFGLGTLVVTTASSAGPLHISGLERGTVERLVADLTRVTEATPDDAT